MSEAERLGQSLKLYFSEQHAVFLSFPGATEGLTAKQALLVPKPGFNSIWGVVNHVCYWVELTLLILQGSEQQPVTPAGKSRDGWFQPDRASDLEWEALRQRTVEINDQLSAVTARLSDEQLHSVTGPWKQTPYAMVQSIIAHNSYHICEMISLRHWQDLWVKA
jgi:uncharacterized damage-inducible protein DinB